ncbi:hypothetical protein MRX96_007765 [Rhipicephalus microplus]
MAYDLPEGFPSGYSLDKAERSKACDLLLKTAAQVLHTGMTGQLSPLHRSPTSTTQSRGRRLKAAGNLLVISSKKAKRRAEPKPRICRAKHITPKNRPATRLQTAAAAMTASPPGQWNRPEPL